MQLKIKEQRSGRRFCACALLTLAGTLLPATVSAETGGYLGGSFGYGKVDNADFDDDKPVYKVFAGIAMMNSIGIEAGYHDFGKSGGAGYSAELTGTTLALVGRIPLSDNFHLFAEVGNLWWRNKISVLDTFNRNLSGNELFYGLGANFSISEIMSIRVDYERYKVELSKKEATVAFDRKFDVDVISLGLQVGF